MRKLSEHEVRDRLRPLRVVVSQSERQEIERRAAAASLSVSAYLRAAGMGATFRSADCSSCGCLNGQGRVLPCGMSEPCSTASTRRKALCQEDARASCCTRDEGGPFGAVL